MTGIDYKKTFLFKLNIYICNFLSNLFEIYIIIIMKTTFDFIFYFFQAFK